MKQSAMQELKWFISDGLDNFDESVKVSEIWAKINELLEMEKQQTCYFGAQCCIMTTKKKSWAIDELYNNEFKSK